MLFKSFNIKRIDDKLYELRYIDLQGQFKYFGRFHSMLTAINAFLNLDLRTKRFNGILDFGITRSSVDGEYFYHYFRKAFLSQYGSSPTPIDCLNHFMGKNNENSI